MSVPFQYDANIRLFPCVPAPEYVGFLSFDTLVHGHHVFTRPMKVRGMTLQVPRLIAWQKDGWHVKWQRHNKVDMKFVSVSKSESPLPGLQQAWQILKDALSTVPLAHSRRRTSDLETPYTWVRSYVAAKREQFYVELLVYCPEREGGFRYIKHSLGNINQVTQKQYEEAFRHAVALRDYIVSCLKAGYYVEHLDWNAPVPRPKSVTIRPTLDDLIAAVDRRIAKRLSSG